MPRPRPLGEASPDDDTPRPGDRTCGESACETARHRTRAAGKEGFPEAAACRSGAHRGGAASPLAPDPRRPGAAARQGAVGRRRGARPRPGDAGRGRPRRTHVTGSSWALVIRPRGRPGNCSLRTCLGAGNGVSGPPGPPCAPPAGAPVRARRTVRAGAGVGGAPRPCAAIGRSASGVPAPTNQRWRRSLAAGLWAWWQGRELRPAPRVSGKRWVDAPLADPRAQCLGAAAAASLPHPVAVAKFTNLGVAFWG